MSIYKLHKYEWNSMTVWRRVCGEKYLSTIPMVMIIQFWYNLSCQKVFSWRDTTMSTHPSRSLCHRWTCMGWDHHLWWPPSPSVTQPPWHIHCCSLLHGHCENSNIHIFCMLITLSKLPTFNYILVSNKQTKWSINLPTFGTHFGKLLMVSESDIIEGEGDQEEELMEEP